jgi:hypothetical protein
MVQSHEKHATECFIASSRLFSSRRHSLPRTIAHFQFPDVDPRRWYDQNPSVNLVHRFGAFTVKAVGAFK